MDLAITKLILNEFNPILFIIIKFTDLKTKQLGDMINGIINNLKTPHKIPYKILRTIIFLYNKKKYKKKNFEEEQNKRFKNLNLNRIESQKKLDEIKKKHPFLNREMSSEHELLFASICLNPKINIRNILEIGTFDGANAFLLSKLFVHSNIETIDLDHKEDDFKDFYNRKQNLEEFIYNRNNLLTKSNNIKFSELNSIKLTFSKKKYDLIWIDGAHGYPVVSIDIINSIKLLNEKGYILIDDINLNNENNDRMYQSSAAFETLSELKKNKIIDFNLFYKRLDANNNCDSKKRKFVALVEKLS